LNPLPEKFISKEPIQVGNQNFWFSQPTNYGLRPENFDGSYPCCCESDKILMKNASIFTDYYASQTKPDVVHDQFSIEHQWEKHGSCADLSITRYIEKSTEMRKEISTFLHANMGLSLSKKNITLVLGTSVSVRCINNEILNEITRCLSKELKEVSCPKILDEKEICADFFWIGNVQNVHDDTELVSLFESYYDAYYSDGYESYGEDLVHSQYEAIAIILAIIFIFSCCIYQRNRRKTQDYLPVQG
jgi:hypothetical protein